MTTIVLDASVVLKWILLDEEESVGEAKKLLDRIVGRELRAIAPDSILVEIANVMFWKKRFEKKEIVSFITYLGGGVINLVSSHNFEVSDLLDVMGEFDLTIYDAYYVLLAKRNDCQVVTFDKTILKIKGLGSSIGDFS